MSIYVFFFSYITSYKVQKRSIKTKSKLFKLTYICLGINWEHGHFKATVKKIKYKSMDYKRKKLAILEWIKQRNIV